MELDITSLLTEDQFPLSHSRAEGGDNAGPNTWNASMERAKEHVLLDTPEKIQAFQEWAADFGAWDQEERDAWTDQETNALFLQWIAGDVRQYPSTNGGRAETLEGIDWTGGQEEVEAGHIPAYLFRADDGRIFFSLSH